MPKFYRKNKKKNNPKYFLNEGVDSDLETLSEEQEESPNGWCFTPNPENPEEPAITPSTGFRDGKPACRGIDDVHVAEKNIFVAKETFRTKNTAVAEQKESMSSIMNNFRDFLNEGYNLDANKDGQLSPEALRRMADELEANALAGAKSRTAGIKRSYAKNPGDPSSDLYLANLIDRYIKDIRKSGALRFDDVGFHGSVMYRILRSGNNDGTPGNEEQGVEKALDYFYSFVSPEGGGDPRAVMADMFPQFEKEVEFIKTLTDMELVQRGFTGGPNYEPTPSTYDNVNSPDGKTFQRVPRPRAFSSEE